MVGGGEADLQTGVAVERFLQSPPPDSVRFAVMCLCVLALCLGFAVGLRLAFRERRLAAPALVSALSVTSAVSALQLKLPPRELPIRWLRVLHEGGGSMLLETAYGAPHTGLGFRAIVHTYASTGLAIRGAAHLNLCLTVVCVGLLFCVAHYAFRALLPALLFTAVYALNVQTISVATSELPSVVLELCFLLGVVGFEAVRQAKDLGRVWSALGLLLVSSVAAVAGLCRIEVCIVALPAVVLTWLQHSNPERLAEIQRALVAGAMRVLTARRGVLIAGAIVTFLLRAIDIGTLPSWLASALNPFDPGLVLYPVLLAQLFPLGIVVLFVLGWIQTCRRAPYFAVVPLTLAVLFKLYEAASHQVMFELVRYTSAMATAAIWVALFGWRELERWALRWDWPARWRTLAVLTLCLVSTLLPMRVDGALTLPIARDHQRAAQALIQVIEENPTCLLVTKHVDPRGQNAEYVFFGQARAEPARMSATSGLEEALDRAAPGAACAMFYFGLDCNRVETPCAKEVASYPEVWSSHWRSEPYSDRDEYGEHVGQFTVALFAIRSPHQGASSE
ncbi:MAG: hypothetical protein R3B07_21190 [Polyangiaceae bacterium]